MKKYFAFSDVHGNFIALHKNLIDVGFEEENPEHILLSLGDLFDRGAQSDKVLEYMLQFWKQGRFIGIRGNHDDMLLEYFAYGKDPEDHFLQKGVIFNLAKNGLNKTIQQLAGLNVSDYLLYSEASKLGKMILEKYPEILNFLESMIHKYTMGNFVFTHAGYSMYEKTGEWYIDNWAITPNFITKYNLNKDKIFVFGHWGASSLNKLVGFKNLDGAELFIWDNFIGIDAKTYITNEVNVLVFYKEDDDWKIEIDESRVPPESAF